MPREFPILRPSVERVSGSLHKPSQIQVAIPCDGPKIVARQWVWADLQCYAAVLTFIAIPGKYRLAHQPPPVGVYEASNRSVVNINTTMTGTNIFLLETVSEGAGSGSVLDQRGNILTNYHVIEGARDIEVTLYDGKSYPAKLVGRDASTDIAV